MSGREPYNVGLDYYGNDEDRSGCELYDFARARIAEDPHMTEAEERASYDRFHGEGAWDRMAEKAVAERAARNARARAAVEAACAHWFAPKQEPSA